MDSHDSHDDDDIEQGAKGDVRLAAPHGVVQIGSFVVKKGTAVWGAIAGMIAFGVVMGLSLHPGDDPYPWDWISAVIGWTYFAAWSVSFYPQVYLNWVRKSVVGMSFDYQFLNLVGFACYSAFNVSYYFIDSIKDDYEKMHGSSSAVASNDVVFALHAELITLITFAQIFIYDRGDQRFHFLPLFATAIFVIIFTLWFIDLDTKGGRYGDRSRPWTWLDFFTGLSWVKLGISVTKYTPQVYLNWKRQRTTGWNIWNVLLDFAGGTLSIAQLFIDCISKSDWSGVSGDPVKFGLGFCSMFFDTIFVIQHYFLYADNNMEDVNADEAAFAKPKAAANDDAIDDDTSDDENAPLCTGQAVNKW